MVLHTMLSFIRKHPIGVGSGAVLAVFGLAWLAFGYFGVHTLFLDDVVDEQGPVFDASPAASDTEGPVADSPELTDPPSASSSTTADEVVVDAAADDEVSAGDTTEASETSDADRIEDAGSVEPPPGTAETAPDTIPTPDSNPDTTTEIVTEYRGVFQGDAHPTAGDAVVLGNGTGQRFLRLENFETDNGPDLNVYLVNSSTGDVSDYVDLGDLKGNIGDQNYEIPVDIDLDVYDEVVIWCVRFGVGFGDASLAPA